MHVDREELKATYQEVLAALDAGFQYVKHLCEERPYDMTRNERSFVVADYNLIKDCKEKIAAKLNALEEDSALTR